MSGPSASLVLKVGGDELAQGPLLAELATTIARLVRAGRPVVVVHGGGDEVTERASELGIPTEKRGGLRVTTPPMLGVVVEVLAGRVNVRLVNALAGAGVPAVGITGASGGLLPVRPSGDPPGSLGWVGEPLGARPRVLQTLLAEGFTPVLAPLGVDGSGHLYNVNADLVAAAVAGALRADLVIVTDVEAVRDAAGAPVRWLAPTELSSFLESGAATDGMVPKLTAAGRALREGASSVWIGRLADVGPDGPGPATGTRIAARRTPAPRVPLLPPETREAVR